MSRSTVTVRLQTTLLDDRLRSKTLHTLYDVTTQMTSSSLDKNVHLTVLVFNTICMLTERSPSAETENGLTNN